MKELKILKDKYNSFEECEADIKKELELPGDKKKAMQYHTVEIAGQKYSIINAEILSIQFPYGYLVEVPKLKEERKYGKSLLIGTSTVNGSPYDMDNGVKILAKGYYEQDYEVGDTIVFNATMLLTIGNAYNANASHKTAPNFYVSKLKSKTDEILSVAKIGGDKIFCKLENGLQFDTWEYYDEMIRQFNNGKSSL